MLLMVAGNKEEKEKEWGRHGKWEGGGEEGDEDGKKEEGEEEGECTLGL